MPNYIVLNKEHLENNIFDAQLCCQREVIIVNGTTSTKSTILTVGVATCSVCIIYDPGTKLAIFAHIDESIKIQSSQSKLLTYLKTKNIALSGIKVFLAGGRFSQPSSRNWAQQLREFWKNIIQEENLNDELLLARDCFDFDLDDAWDYIKQNTTPKVFSDFDAYLKEVAENPGALDKSYIYMHGTRESPIAKRIADILKNWCKEKKLIENTDYNVVGIQAVDDEFLGKKLLIDLQILDKTLFPIIGFDAKTGEMFIINDLCYDVLKKLIDDLGIEDRWNISLETNEHEQNYLNEIKDEFDGANKYQTSSPLSENAIVFLKQKNARFHYTNDVLYIESVQLTKDVREQLNLDRKRLSNVSFEQLRFLREHVPGITIEIENKDSKSLKALVTYNKNERNLKILMSVVENWKSLKEQGLSILFPEDRESKKSEDSEFDSDLELKEKQSIYLQHSQEKNLKLETELEEEFAAELETISLKK